MIKLTYQVICDICKKECTTENYDCTNYPLLQFPQPTMAFTFNFGYPTEMCHDCAAPLRKARDEVIDKVRADRLQELNKAAEENGEPL